MSWTQDRAKVAALSRSLPADDPELIEARRNLKAAKLEDHIAAAVAAFPPLTREQLDRIALHLANAPAHQEAKAA